MLQPGILVYLSTCAGQVEPGLPCQATHTEGGKHPTEQMMVKSRDCLL